MLQFQKGMLEVKTDIISQIITKTKTEKSGPETSGYILHFGLSSSFAETRYRIMTDLKKKSDFYL